RVPVQLASDFVVAALPGIHEGMAKMIGDGFKAMDAKQNAENGPEEKANRSRGQRTEPHRQPTAKTVPSGRQQTGQTAAPHRQQTDESAVVAG
ncbi:MAG: hypothetical protein K2R98_13025, partial [Gemmataceae bacterium]|nr:hypothetical protein [Gemmataceae bacterium]